jgi:hypothetical protein
VTFYRLIHQFDGTFHPETETEMPGQTQVDRAEIDPVGGKIFSALLSVAPLFDYLDQGTAVMGGYLKRFHNRTVLKMTGEISG